MVSPLQILINNYFDNQILVKVISQANMENGRIWCFLWSNIIVDLIFQGFRQTSQVTFDPEMRWAFFTIFWCFTNKIINCENNQQIST